MSDPVSNAEIEDVLSSIRRLVSEEPSPFLNRKRPAPKSPDKFVLTPALRVAETGDATETDAEDTPDAEDSGAVNLQNPVGDAASAETPDNGMKDAGEPDDAGPVEPEDPVADAPANSIDPETVATHRQTLEQRIVELESALQQSPDEWEPDGSEAQEQSAVLPLDFNTLQGGTAFGPAESVEEGPTWHETDEGSGATFDWTEEAREDTHPADPGEDAQAPAMLADPLAVDGDDTPAAARETSNLRMFPRSSEAPREPAVTDEAWTDAVADDASRPDAGDPQEIAESLRPADDDDGSHEAATSDFETDARDDVRREDTEQPVSAFRTSRAGSHGTADLGQTDPEPDGVAAFERGAPDLTADEPGRDGGPDDDGPDLFAEEGVIDEAVIRDLVSQLVREELQGVLGERITRNVRRLVRREIQRALEVRDMR